MKHFTYKGRVVDEIQDGIAKTRFVVYGLGRNYMGALKVDFSSERLEECKTYIDMVTS